MRFSWFVGLPLVSAFWRLPCAKPITIERTDPIVVPGAVAGHIHTVMGASGFNAVSTPDSIRQSRCSTCTVNEDFSNYWIQTLFYQHRNGTMESVKQNGGMLVYYLQRRGTDSEKLYAFPDQLRMVAGTPSRNYFDGSLEARAISYACIDYSGNGGPETHAFPQKNCPQGLRVQVFFPSCWDGVNTDSTNHKSHMAYPSNVDSGTCPSTHPKRLISIFFEVLYNIDVYKDDWLDANGKPTRAMPFFWSTGDNTGFGHHGDFMNGWDSTVLQKAVDDCTDDSGVVTKCQHFTFRTDADSCLPEYKPANGEVVTGLLTAIPGLAPFSVASFNPCGVSPTTGLDQTSPGVPIGACTGAFENVTAYSNPPAQPDNKVTGTTAIVVKNPNPIPQEGYLGCWSDNPHQMEKNFGNGYTAVTCRAKVQSTSSTYVVFALQFGGECWASTDATKYKTNGASTECNQICNADPLQFCGNGQVNQVYSVNNLAVPPTNAPTMRFQNTPTITPNTNAAMSFLALSSSPILSGLLVFALFF